MSGGIFLLQGDESLIEMREQAYDSEAVLQRLLAQYPNLLAGDQINRAEPRRWLLVAREMGVPGEEVGGDRWSLDHLFLDQDGVPTLVEVKRSADTRIRREVVGQMLDYAANAVVYWPVERIRARFEAGQTTTGADPTLAINEFLGPEGDAEQFWQRVKTNLQAGRIRLVFVADEIPGELRRVVEFLNGQMDPAEVIAIEIRQFVGQGRTSLVPQVVGQTERAKQQRVAASGSPRRWDEASFLNHIRNRWGVADENAAKRILAWARESRLRLEYSGQKWGSCYPFVGSSQGDVQPFCLWFDERSVKIEIEFVRLARISPFHEDYKRDELRDRLNEFASPQIATDATIKRPSIQIAPLRNEAAMGQFLETFSWVIHEIRTSDASP
ncbi:MAG: hypothetical protein IT340_07940 [Chloroflexi bacterium]|nr:hypothetical protein [Chloroflexota bacterium]